MTKRIEDAMVDIGSVSRGIQNTSMRLGKLQPVHVFNTKEITMGSLEDIDFAAVLTLLLGLLGGGSED
jgi:hypothetical protein